MMINKQNFLFGIKPHSNTTMGLSLASTWAWGVSIIVGTQIVQGKGLLAFAIWGAANALALTLFGMVSRKLVIRETVADFMPKTLRMPYYYFTLLLQFFSVLVNITAIKTAFVMLGLPGYSWHVLTSFLFIIMFFKGFDANIKGDIAFILIWLAVLAGVVIVMPKNNFILIASMPEDIAWAVWGAMILFCGPVVDQQMWQRKISMRDRFSLKPFFLGSVIFAAYMALVGLLGIYGAGCQAAIAVIIICVASSTLQSALSALSCYGGSLGRGKALMAGCFFIAVACLAFDLPVLTVWLLYGSLRVVPALYIFYLAFRRYEHGHGRV